MEVTWTPVPHECKMPDPAEFPRGTRIRCDEIRAYTGPNTGRPVLCSRQWIRGVTVCRWRPTWVEVDRGW